MCLIAAIVLRRWHGNDSVFIISSKDNQILIPSGHVAILWSDEYLHADASYQVRNRQLLIAITSKKTVYKLKNVEVVSH